MQTHLTPLKNAVNNSELENLWLEELPGNLKV